MNDGDPIPLSRIDKDALTPEMARILFGTEWDDAINFFRVAANELGFTDEMFHAKLDEQKKMLESLVPIPKDSDTRTVKPYVELSDMMALAALARAVYENVDKVPDDA